MKYIVMLCFTCIGIASQSQTIQDFFSDKAGTVIWLGIDYTHVRLVGEFTHFKDAGPISAEEMRDKYFPAWNSLVLSEAAKYDFKGMFMLSALVPDIGMVTSLNATTDLTQMNNTNAARLGCPEIKRIVSAYDLKEQEGVGIILVAENMNKSIEMAKYFVAVFNLKTREVLLCEEVNEKAGGIGIRNYWAGTLYNLVKDGKKNLYWIWKDKYVK